LTSRVVAGALVAALVVTQLPQWPYSTKQDLLPITTKQESALPTALLAAIPAGDPVTITYPYPGGLTPQAMEWQMDSGYTFRLLGGYAHVTNPNGGFVTIPRLMSPPALQRFLSDYEGIDLYGAPLPLSPELVSITRTTLSKYDVGMVIVDRSVVGSGPVIKLFNEALGPPKISTGQFSMWVNWHK
jgi:hypothetical protein